MTRTFHDFASLGAALKAARPAPLPVTVHCEHRHNGTASTRPTLWWDEWQVKHGGRIVGRFSSESEALCAAEAFRDLRARVDERAAR